MPLRQSIPHFTPEQVDALPIGPHCETIVPLTAEDYAAGMCGKCKTVVDRSKVPVFLPHGPDDAVWQCGSDGSTYTIGKYTDGTYYKSPFWL